MFAGQETAEQRGSVVSGTGRRGGRGGRGRGVQEACQDVVVVGGGFAGRLNGTRTTVVGIGQNWDLTAADEAVGVLVRVDVIVVVSAAAVVIVLVGAELVVVVVIGLLMVMIVVMVVGRPLVDYSVVVGTRWTRDRGAEGTRIPPRIHSIAGSAATANGAAWA